MRLMGLLANDMSDDEEQPVPTTPEPNAENTSKEEKEPS